LGAKLGEGAKLIILDFFATWCTACIRELPKLNRLQQQYNGNLQVFLVTYEHADKIAELKKRNKLMAASTLPIITSDTILHQRFPHRLLPHTVWLNGLGRVLAITEPHHLTVANIGAALQSQAFSLPLKKDQVDFDRTKPLLQAGNGGTETDLRFRSLFTAYLPGIASISHRSVTADSTLQRLVWTNHSRLSLYATAAGGTPSSRWRLQVADTAAWFNPGLPFTDWAEANTVCYELTIPSSTPREKLRTWMRQDLDRFFGLTATWKKEEEPCWVLVRTPAADTLLRTKGDKPRSTLLESDSAVKKLINRPLSKLVETLNLWLPGRPQPAVVVDETGFPANVDLELPVTDLYHIHALRTALQCYGLDLIPAERELDLFIIADSPSVPPSPPKQTNKLPFVNKE
jgi:thiol-disulfide isomerase/thioredoxin